MNRNDKRKYLRFDMDTRVNFNVQEQGHGITKTFAGISRNVCIEGVCFISDQQVEVGRDVRLEIFLTDQKNPLRLEGEVRWSHLLKRLEERDLYETGVRLFTVESNDQTRFINYIYNKGPFNEGKQT